MEQNNVPVPNLRHDRPLDGNGVLGGPVPGIHRPAQNGQQPHLGHLPHAVAAAASRRPQKHRLAVLRQQVLGIDNLLGDTPAAHFLHVLVGKTVVADFVALAENPLGQIGELFHPVAAEQEGCSDVPLLQTVQQLGGETAGGAVVEGQGHIFVPGHRLCRQNQQAQTQYESQNAPHRSRSFHGIEW